MKRVHTQRPQSNQLRILPEPKNANEPRSLKRKKSSPSVTVPGPTSSSGWKPERAENKVPAASKNIAPSSLQKSSARVFGAMRRPPSLERDLLVRVSSKKDKRHNDVDEADRHSFTGPLAVAEYERMKKVIDVLKESLYESRKLSKRQAKQLDDSRAEANAAVMAMKDRDIELADANAKCRKYEQLRSTIETSVQCQICMDLPDKPFALNPCGHVFCLLCLQEWFHKAPPSLDDIDVDPDELTDPQYILMRAKTCPSCRTVVKHRPIPIFMIKSVVTVLKRTNSPHSSSPRSRHNNDDEDNPWKGIFASSEEEEDVDDDDGSPLESDSDDLGDWYRHTHIAQLAAAIEDNAATESEVEDDEDDVYDDASMYTLPRWAPPTVSITGYDLEDDDGPDTMKLLQRGCTRDMLQSFEVSYSHDSGIVIALRSLDHFYDDDEEDAEDVDKHRVFLGWNISLAPDDLDGELFLSEIVREIQEIPERWRLTPTPGVPLAMDARRLVLADEAEHFDTTDTEAWIDNEDF